jgi:DinB superfamily
MNELMKTITEQTQILFANVETTLNSIEDDQLYNTNICDWPLAEQIYHMLHSFDQWFINPNNYKEPDILQRKTDEGRKLSKLELIEFYDSIKVKISSYLEHLKGESLSSQPPDCQFNRLALMLGQYRHLMYHIGFIHSCLRIYTRGTSPPYHGLGLPIPPTELK